MNTYSLVPEFLTGPSGRLFCLHYKPSQSTNSGCPAIIHVPALTEEMNKSRRMVSLQARQFVEAGCPVYVFDLYGTGDSDGELEDVTWSCWQLDLQYLCDYVAEQNATKVLLWGLRGGCLLAASCLDHPDVMGGLFWQPLRDGQQVVTQLNRLLRIAGGNTDYSFEQGQNDGVIEVSGYTFNQRLLGELPDVSLTKWTNLNKKTLILINISILQEGGIGGMLTYFRDALLPLGGDVRVSSVIGDPFWMTPEVVLAPNLLVETDKMLKLMQVR